MPLPKPDKGETKKEFIGKCMANATMNSEYPEKDQRFAICNSLWKGKSMGDKDIFFYTRKQAASPETFDAEKRTVDVVMTTEAPVQIWDFRHGRVSEYLLIDGMQIPPNKQVPLLDDHNRWAGANSVIGSVRNIRKQAPEALGRVHFARSSEGIDSIIEKIEDGHLTDFSVGYRADPDPKYNIYIKDGERSEVKGKTYQGPAVVRTKWDLKELSITPIGADPNAKARSEKINREEQNMEQEVIKALEKKGLKQGATQTEIVEFLNGLESQPGSGVLITPQVMQIDTGEIERAAAKERARCREISALCRQVGFSEAEERKFIGDDNTPGLSLEEVRGKALAKMIDGQKEHSEPNSGIEIGEMDTDKFRAVGIEGLSIRAGVYIEKPQFRENEWQSRRIEDFARRSCALAGLPAGGTIQQLFKRAMTTSDFPHILANVAEKKLWQGFETASETWRIWCDVGSVSDFKQAQSPRKSETDELDKLAENQAFPYGKFTEAIEYYKINPFGKQWAFSRMMMINDDLGAFDTMAEYGEAAARTVEDVAYGAILTNPTMGDGKALFHSDHGNLAGSGAIVGLTTLSAGILAMKSQKDLRQKRSLDIRAEYYLGPNATEGANEDFFQASNWSDDLATTPNATLINNRYAGTRFKRIYTGRVDDSASPLAWYLMTRKGKTVRVFFLNGQQRPTIETARDWDTKGLKISVAHDVGAKCMDWRGVYKNPGA